jgi:hypothetical protein
MLANTSVVDDTSTANTKLVCAKQRAENLFVLGVKNVLELCVGPSLKVLEQAYSEYNINVFGNDIDKRWVKYYPTGNWIIGDALSLDYSRFDCLIYAPPLSQGCTGTRADSLRISQVTPKYDDFISASKNFAGVRCLVLPGRSLATKEDRKDFHALTFQFQKFEVIPLTNKGVVKYYDLYIL